MKEEPTMHGHAAVLAVYPTWKHGVMPRWFQKALRLHAIRQGTWKRNPYHYQHLDRRLFDHWGSIRPYKTAPAMVIAMPYGRCDALARKFADDLECDVSCSNDGPWCKGSTALYTFSYLHDDDE